MIEMSLPNKKLMIRTKVDEPGLSTHNKEEQSLPKNQNGGELDVLFG